MSTSKPKRAGGDGDTPPAMEIAVWVLFVLALVATAYILVNEPEEGAAMPSGSKAAKCRFVYLMIAAFGIGICGALASIVRGDDFKSWLLSVVTLSFLIGSSFVIDPMWELNPFWLYLALSAAALGACLGVNQILREGGRRNLFGAAVLFNLIMACFWILRFTIA